LIRHSDVQSDFAISQHGHLAIDSALVQARTEIKIPTTNIVQPVGETIPADIRVPDIAELGFVQLNPTTLAFVFCLNHLFSPGQRTVIPRLFQTQC
jgi:hypothetical protein